MSRIAIDDTYSDAAVEAIMRARFARYDLRIIEGDRFAVEIETGLQRHRFPGKTKRAAMLSALGFTP